MTYPRVMSARVMSAHVFSFVIALSSVVGADAQADVIGLPVAADQCAIGYALTGQVLSGCAQPDRAGQLTRSVSPSEGEGYFVHFEFGSNALTMESQAHLQRLSGLLNEALGGLCVKLVGHTDTVGSARYNMALSKDRAKSVRLFMAGPGLVDGSRVATEGMGEQVPLIGIPGDDSRNRRVEILARQGTGGFCS